MKLINDSVPNCEIRLKVIRFIDGTILPKMITQNVVMASIVSLHSIRYGKALI